MTRFWLRNADAIIERRATGGLGVAEWPGIHSSASAIISRASSKSRSPR